MTSSHWIKAGSIAMFTAVALGAFGAHGLKTILNDYSKSVFETAVRYHLIHGLALFIVAWITSQNDNSKATWAGWMFIAGITLFSGSLYALSITGIKSLGAITPLGGICFLAGWALLALSHV